MNAGGSSTPAAAAPAGKAVRLLVVEDSEDDARLVARTLRQGGFQPTYRRVQDIDALRQAFRTERWDAVLSDFRMPGFNGVQALRDIRTVDLDVLRLRVEADPEDEPAEGAGARLDRAAEPAPSTGPGNVSKL